MKADTTIKRIDSNHSPTGEMGQKYLASGEPIAMRLWENQSLNVEATHPPAHVEGRDKKS